LRIIATPMPPESAVDRLAALPLFESVPRSELEGVAALGEVRTFEAGTLMSDPNAPMEEMFVVFSGRAALFVPKGGALRKLAEGVAGQIFGPIPYSRMQGSPGRVTIEKDLTAFVLHKRHFPVLIREYPELMTALVHHLVDRARNFRAVQLNDDRLESLSRLASGFAHELNNPASAAVRTAQSLVGLLDAQDISARELAALRLSDDQLAIVDAVRDACGRPASPRTALEAADREDDIAEWLTRHGLDDGVAETIAVSELATRALDDLASAVPAAALGIVIRWITSGCAARAASHQIEVATGRIHDLVGAVKGFTFMDRQGVPEDVDVARGLANTLAMLEGKARTKSATVHLETAAGLPRIYGYGTEINQVWEKLVDNALDAVGDQGHVTITATTRGDSILVRVADDGPGIPQEIRARVFDPFFTTKPIGQGTGLGLDLARRIVHSHGGDIEFSTQPGRTVFRVSLPASKLAIARM
jgi:signal transduction histidine kinase